MAKRIWNYNGLFSAWGPANGSMGSISEYVEKAWNDGFRWFALETQQFEGKSLDEQVSELRQALVGRKPAYFGLWQDTGVDPSTDTAEHYKPNFMILNVETPNAHERAKAFITKFRAKHPKLPMGVVTNFGGIDTKAEAAVYVKNNIVCIPEAYMNSNPQATPMALVFESVRRGWKQADVFPCYGVWGHYNPKVYSIYDSKLPGHSVYLAEGLYEA